MNVVDDPGPQNALSFNAIRQSFPGLAGEAPLSVLTDISFPVPRGRFVSVIGPSGCGKSTLIQMAAGLLRPTLGKVLHNGSIVTGVNRTNGFVPQQAQLLPWKTLM